MCASETGLLRAICSLLPYLFPLFLSLVTLVFAGFCLKSIGKLLSNPLPRFVDNIHSADIALQMIGSSGEIGPIVEEAGHLPLLRNLALDSQVFVPLYTTSFAISTLLLIGMPFACGAFSFHPMAALAWLLIALGALFDWSENSCLTKALRLNAQGGDNVSTERQKLLGQGRTRALVKFILLGSVAGLLAFHAGLPDATSSLPGWGRQVLAALFGTAALGMFTCPVRPRYLEPAVALAGCGITLLFTLHTWRLLP
jgi:hypothetical protein